MNNGRSGREPFGDDAFWYRDAVVYQTHVRAFYDSNADGIGDFRGLSEKLDYLQDLGVTALWLLPFYPSPLRDDGYDISDYTSVHPAYGSLRDFQAFLRAAHTRGLHVITELVLNHTSDQHPWFQRARRSPPGSRARDFYVWSETPDKYQGVRVIFQDFESSNWAWDPMANAYYWHRFYSHQPDLNFDSADTRKALLQVVDFWLGMGVDGLRLDAVPYLYEREGTSCENLPETHQFLADLRRHVDENYRGRMLLAEANQWPEDAIAYFGKGDECHMAFNFPLMPRLFMAVQMEDRFPLVDILQQTPPIPDNCQWALFLRNHDELTLEMVTDEDRDYMYRVYAEDRRARINLGIRRRLAPLLGNNRRRIELMNALLLSLPGSPIIYYGDEIGMGDNIYLGDRNSVRTPMQWSADRNAGFSRANPQSLYLPVNVDPEYHYETVNVEAQQNNPNSLRWWMKRLIALRRRNKAFSRGSLEFLYTDNRKILAFIRRHQEQTIFVVANLSRFVQCAELDLSEFKGRTPVEMFGRTEFPPIGDLPYFITLGPHSFYWFSLEPQRVEPQGDGTSPESRRFPVLEVAGGDESLFRGRSRAALEAILPDYLRGRRWFGAKARVIQSIRVTEAIPVSPAAEGPQAFVLLLRVSYTEGEAETYLVSAAVGLGRKAEQVMNDIPHGVIARLHVGDSEASAVLYEALFDREFTGFLLRAIGRRRRFKGGAGELVASPAGRGGDLRTDSNPAPEPSVMRVEQSNTSVVYGDRYILKLFRRPDEGTNPDLEIGRFLTERAPDVRVPAVAGFLEYRRERAEPMTIGMLQAFVPNEGDAWHYALDAVRDFLERVLTEAAEVALKDIQLPHGSPVSLGQRRAPAQAWDMIGDFLQAAELLGRRTGELHSALASASEDPAFAPEPVTPFYQRSAYQSMRTLAARVMQLLERELERLPERARDDARAVLSLQPRILRSFRTVLDRSIGGMLIRCHGDYHLGQVLYTGKDFVIIDFEGEPARPLGERRLKRSALRDVAAMLRSFHYASYAALGNQVSAGGVHEERLPWVEAWLRFWNAWVGAAFVRSYLETVPNSPLLPDTQEELEVLLNAMLLDKAVYEVGYELNNRPEWLHIPLKGILQIMESNRAGG